MVTPGTHGPPGCFSEASVSAWLAKNTTTENITVCSDPKMMKTDSTVDGISGEAA